MTLRKGKKETAESKPSISKKLRTNLPSKTARQRPPTTGLVIDFGKEKDYRWLLEQIGRELVHKRRTPMPVDLKPALASVGNEPFNNPEWQFEIKWDGYRALAYLQKGKVDLRSRNNLTFNRKFSPLVAALKQWPVNAIVDGEVVILTGEGKADFGALQAWEKTGEGELLFFVFDLLWIDGIDLRSEPLSLRRELLRKLVPDRGPVRFSDSIEEYGVDFFKAAKENGLEGIIGKNMKAPYNSGQRSREWIKLKAEKRHEAIICGYTKNNGTDRHFSSLVLGVPSGDKLTYIGMVGTGFSQSLQEQILFKLRPLTTTISPFAKEPPLDAFVQWVRPRLLCEVKYTELTKEGVMRHPAFITLRDDKTAGEYNPEESAGDSAETKNGQELIIHSREQNRLLEVDSQQLQLTNLKKIYWPTERITKGDMLQYYSIIAPYMVPYLLDRPQSLNRFPNGINGESFYQKNMKGKVDSWLTTFERLSVGTGKAKDFLVCTGTASLLYMANLGCIEINPWHSRTTSPLYPDWCVIDLDPGRISFEKVIETAQVIHRLLESIGVPSYPKTSGSTGIHIYIPLSARYSYEQSKQLAEIIAILIHNELPKFTSIERNPLKRKDKIYLDFLQNRSIQTICAPYSLRPKPGATVSAPLHWQEVKKGLQMKQFTIKNMNDRVKSEGDLFDGVLRDGINLNDVLQTLSSLL
jgi:bifunctional non-homologous end joining protein LigD